MTKGRLLQSRGSIDRFVFMAIDDATRRSIYLYLFAISHERIISWPVKIGVRQIDGGGAEERNRGEYK